MVNIQESQPTTWKIWTEHMFLLPKGSSPTPLFEEGGHVQAVSTRMCGQERLLLLAHVQNLEKVEFTYFHLEVGPSIQAKNFR